MLDGFFSTGAVARELGVSQAMIRALCAAGLIACEVTGGGQYRIPVAEVERLKRDGLPAAPHPMPNGDAEPKAPRRSTSGVLLAAPSAEPVASVLVDY